MAIGPGSLAVVTGASSGIGLELATLCAAQGFPSATMMAEMHRRMAEPGLGNRA